METDNNVDEEVNINSDSDDSDSEVEDMEKPWQRQQNRKEGGNTDDDYDSLRADFLRTFDDTEYKLQMHTDYELQQQQQQQLARATSIQATSTPATTILGCGM